MKRVCLFSLCLWMLLSCESAPYEPPLPRIDEIRSPIRHLPPPHDPSLPVARALMNVRKLWMPLDLPTDAAWEKVNENAFSQVTRSVWNANGLRVGLIHRKDLEAMGKLLPPVHRIQNRRVQGSDHPTSLNRSPLLRGVVTVDLTLASKSVREEKITGGHAQLILQVNREGVITLTPHHHVPKASLWPRGPLEKELDGRFFLELSLGVQLTRQQVLVVGLYRPWSQIKPQSSPSSANERVIGTGEIGDGSEEVLSRYDLADPPPLVNHLGQALLTHPSGGQSVQLLLLITVESWYRG